MKVTVTDSKIILKTPPTNGPRVIRISEQGPKGNETFHVGPVQPEASLVPYAWLQTGLGDGTGFSLWIYTP